MKLDVKDIESIAKGRVNRAEGNRGTYWMVGGVLAVVLGYFLLKTQPVFAWVLCIGGVAAVIYYMNKLGKKQNIVKSLLYREWVAEEKAKQLGKDKK